MASNEVGTYVLPVILSFEGVDKQVNNTLGKSFGNIGKKASQDLARGAGAGLKDLEKEVEAAGKAYEKLKSKAADALGKVRSDEAKVIELRNQGKQDTAQYIAAEERLNKARRDAGRASRDAESGHTSLLAAQQRLGDGADDLGGRFGRLGGSMAAMGALAGGAALAGVAALGAGAVVVGKQLYDLGAQFDDLSDTLQVKTGKSGQALDELKKSVERLGTTSVPDTFENIGNVAADVTRNLHLTGAPLEAVTSRLANLQRLGVDVDIRTLSQAFHGFGVDVKDQVPALNNLYEASTKSGLSIDEMLAAVVKGGPALRQFGFGFGEAAALMGTFEEAGLDGEKSTVALNKAFAFFSKEGIPAKQGLKDVVTQIQALGDTPAAGDLALKVFGAKGGSAFLEAIQSGTVDLQSLSNSLSSTGLDINQVSDDTADWSEKWQLLKNDVSVALEPLASGVFDGLNTELGKAADYIVEHKDTIIDAFVSIGDFAISMTESTIKSIGQFAEGFGYLIAPIGDVMGAVNDFQAWQADIRGDHETADALRKQGQEFYGMGESLTKFGREAQNADLDGLRDGLHNIGREAKAADDKVLGLGNSITTLSSTKPPAALPGWFPNVTGGGGAPSGPGWFGQTGGGLPASAGAPGSLDDLVATGGGGRGVGINLQVNAQAGQQYGLPKGTDTGGYGTGNADTFPQWVMALATQFDIKPSTYSGHQETDRHEAGFAPNPGHENRGIDWSGSVDNMQRFADYLATIPGALEQVIWQNPNTGQTDTIAGGKPVSGYYDAGTLADHRNHVHTRQSAPIPTPGNTVALSGSYAQAGADWDTMAQKEASGDWAANTGNNFFGGLQFTQPSWEAAGGLQYAARADLATPEQQKSVAEKLLAMQGPGAWPKTFTANTNGAGVSPNLTNAYGADYKPGIGTPGVNEYGEPGYYETDPRRISQAARSAQDSLDHIADADQAVIDSNNALADAVKERDSVAQLSEIERAAQNKDLDKANADVDRLQRQADRAAKEAGRSREDAGWANQDLEEAKKGNFKPAAKASKGGKSGSGDLSEIGSIFGSFLKETTGLDGSLFPDISNLAPVQMLGTLLGAFGGSGTDASGVAGTTSAPFGIPDVAVPSPGTAASGIGLGPAPGPAGPNITIDQSIGNVNGDVKDVMKQRDAGLSRAVQRIPVGS